MENIRFVAFVSFVVVVVLVSFVVRLVGGFMTMKGASWFQSSFAAATSR